MPENHQTLIFFVFVFAKFVFNVAAAVLLVMAEKSVRVWEGTLTNFYPESGRVKDGV